MARQELGDPSGIVILGGGLSGVAASYTSGAPVYEAAAHVGGAAASDTVDGFTFDRGIHVLQTHNARVISLFDELGIEFAHHTRRAFIYYNGSYAEYPFQVNTAGLPLGLRARCVWGFLRRQSEPEPANYEQWINRSVGRGFASTFLIPYSEKFWTVHPREMTFEWTGNRVPQPTLSQVVRGALWNRQTAIGSNAQFRYPAGPRGYGRIAETIAARGGSVHLRHRAIRIDTAGRRVHFENGSQVDYTTLVASIPLPELVRLCEAPAAVTAAASELRTNSILAVNIGIGRERLSEMHWAHYPEKDISFFRLSFPHNFSPGMAPAGTSSISAEVSYSSAHPLDRSTIVDRVIEDLKRVGLLKRDDPILTATTSDIPYAYCIYDRPRNAALRTIHQWLRQQGIVPCGRYGLWTYFWSDEAVLSGLKTGESIARQVGTGAAHAQPAEALGS